MIRAVLQPLPQPYRLVIVEDDTERLMELYDTCWEETKENYELKGFRKGEIPRSVAEKKIGVEVVYKPVIDTLVAEAIKQTRTNFCELDDVAIEWQTDKKPLTIIARGFLFPVVESCEYHDMIANFERLLVTDEEINTMLQKAAYSEAEESELETLEGVSEEDLSKVNVLVNFMMDDVEAEKVLANQTDYRIDPTKTIYGFEPLLANKKVGEVFEHKCTLPEDFFDAKSAGRQVQFQVKVVKIFTLELPEIDDKLAVKIGYENLEQMREMITRDLEETKKRTNEVLYRDHIMGLLVAKTKVTPMPDSMVKRELDMMLKGAVTNANKLQGSNITPEQFLSATNMTKEDWYNQHWAMARQKLLGNIALKHIAEQEGLTPTQDECDEMLEELLPKDMEIDKAKVNAQGLEEYVLLKKAQDFLIELIAKNQESKSDQSSSSS